MKAGRTVRCCHYLTQPSHFQSTPRERQRSFFCQSQVFLHRQIPCDGRIAVKGKVCGEARHRADWDHGIFGRTPLSYCHLLWGQLACLYTSSIAWWLLSKKARQRTFSLCGPGCFPLGQMLICQRVGCQPVALLSSVRGCGPGNDGKFCLGAPVLTSGEMLLTYFIPHGTPGAPGCWLSHAWPGVGVWQFCSRCLLSIVVFHAYEFFQPNSGLV